MPATKKQPKRKRLKRGRDWHAWAWKYGKKDLQELWVFGWWTEFNRPPRKKLSPHGRWVRVKFTEVPAAKKGD